MATYLGSLKRSKVNSLQKLVVWNKAHTEEALTDRDFLPLAEF